MARLGLAQFAILLLMALAPSHGCRSAKNYWASRTPHPFAARDRISNPAVIPQAPVPTGLNAKTSPPPVIGAPSDERTAWESLTADGDLPEVELPIPPANRAVGGAVSIGWSSGMPF